MVSLTTDSAAGTSVAGIGDTIAISVTVCEPATQAIISLFGGANNTMYQDSSTDYSYDYTVSEGTDEGPFMFEIHYEDVDGEWGPAENETTDASAVEIGT